MIERFFSYQIFVPCIARGVLLENNFSLFNREQDDLVRNVSMSLDGRSVWRGNYWWVDNEDLPGSCIVLTPLALDTCDGQGLLDERAWGSVFQSSKFALYRYRAFKLVLTT